MTGTGRGFLPGLCLLVAGCMATGVRPPALDSYRAWLDAKPVEPAPSHFKLTALDGRWWFVAPSGRRFLAVSGATTPAAGRPVPEDAALPLPYLTAGIPEIPGGRPIPHAIHGLPDPYDEATLPAITVAAFAAGQFADDPFCLGHLAIPEGDLNRIPLDLPVSSTSNAAATRWFQARTTGGAEPLFRADFADRLYGMLTTALRAADDDHLVFTGWYDPGATSPAVAKCLGRWGDAVCVRISLNPDAVRMAEDAHAATGKPLLIWLADPNPLAEAPPNPELKRIGLALLALPYVVALDSLNPPSADNAYITHRR